MNARMASTNRIEKPLKPLFPRLPRWPSADEGGRGRPPSEGSPRRGDRRGRRAPRLRLDHRTGAGDSGGGLEEHLYDHFQSKEECFLVTFDSVVAQLAEEVAGAYGVSGDERERLVAALRRFMEIVVERPEATALAIVDSLTLGSTGIAHRERAWEAFEQMARQYFLTAAPEEEVSDLTVRAIVAGVTGVVYQYLRNGRTAELPGLVEPLIDWALGYQGPDNEQVLRAVAAAGQQFSEKVTEGEEGALGWEEPPDSPLSRSTLSQRERIIRAAAKVVVEYGYESLSIPAISAAAGTSNQTFYENFDSKREAFIAAYDIVCEKAFRVVAKAFESGVDGPEAVGTALRALAEYIAVDRTYARLAFVEMMAAGPTALDRNEEMMTRVLSFFELEGAKGLGGKAPRVVLEATSAGIWFVVQREIASNCDNALPGKAPELARLALSPFNAAASAPRGWRSRACGDPCRAGLAASRKVRSPAFSVASPIVIWNIASSASEASGRIRSKGPAHLGPILLRPARLVEGLPYLPHEELDEGARHSLGAPPQLLRRLDRGLRGDAQLDQGGPGVLQAGADHLDLAVGPLASHVGEWQGKDPEGKPMTAPYRLASGGTSLVKTMTLAEKPSMTTMCQADKGELMLTHYCALGNQPRMRAAMPKGDAKTLASNFVDATSIAKPTDTHMHNMSLSFQDQDHFTQEWVPSEDGKGLPHRLEFARVK